MMKKEWVNHIQSYPWSLTIWRKNYIYCVSQLDLSLSGKAKEFIWIMFTVFPNSIFHCLEKQRSLYEVLQFQKQPTQSKNDKIQTKFRRVLASQYYRSNLVHII